MPSLKWLVILGFAAAGCGGNDVKCGSGTMLADGTCVGSGPTCGLGTTLVGGMCVGSGGATCGSGTTLVNGACVGDSCGPGTVLQNGACNVDTSAPDPVSGLTATPSSTSVALSWTAGTGATGSLVARLVAGAYDTPTSLSPYTVGQTLPGGATVIADGAGTSVTDNVTTPGRYSYLVWPRNASGKLGFPREVTTVVTVPAQTGTVVIDVTAGTATISAQPANVALETANFAFDSGTGTVTFDLSATQNTGGQLYNLKAVFGPPSVGDVVATTGTTAAGDSFLTFGLGAILPANKVTATVTIDTVQATDVVTLPLTIVESSIAIVGSNAIDVAGGTNFSMQLPILKGRNQNRSIFAAGTFDASGRYFYGMTRWSSALFRLDTATGDVTAVAPVPMAAGSGMCTIYGGDGFMYVSAAMGGHRDSNSYGIAIAKVDPVTMTTVASATITTTSTGKAHACALHGTTLATGIGPNMYLLNTSTMTFTDTNATTADVIDPITVTSGGPITHLLFSPDGATIYATESQSSQIFSVDPVAFTAANYHLATGRVLGLAIDAAGTLWWGQPSNNNPGLYSFDGTTETAVPNFTTQVDAIGPRTGNTVAVTNRSGSKAFVVDVTDGTVSQVTGVDASRLAHEYSAFTTP